MKKGLCETCNQGIGCLFPRRFPVLLCEEFSSKSLKILSLKKTHRQKVRAKTAK